jgi:hypothetical protein
LLKDSSRLQTMTDFNKKFLQGGPDASRRQFFQKAPPLAARGKAFYFLQVFIKPAEEIAAVTVVITAAV